MIRYKNQSETQFFIGLSVLIWGVSFGAPVLTLNRVSLILWVFIGLLNQYFYFSNCQENNVKSVGEKFEVKPKNKKDRKYKIAWWIYYLTFDIDSMKNSMKDYIFNEK